MDDNEIARIGQQVARWNEMTLLHPEDVRREACLALAREAPGLLSEVKRQREMIALYERVNRLSGETIHLLEQLNRKKLEEREDRALDLLQAKVNAWQAMTFPESTVETVLTHLAREMRELDTKRNAEETADCVMLLMAFAGKLGFSLIGAVLDKFEVCKKRTWGEPDAEGVREHVREHVQDSPPPDLSVGINNLAKAIGTLDAEERSMLCAEIKRLELQIHDYRAVIEVALMDLEAAQALGARSKRVENVDAALRHVMEHAGRRPGIKEAAESPVSEKKEGV
jgi:hypothetical protein